MISPDNNYHRDEYDGNQLAGLFLNAQKFAPPELKKVYRNLIISTQHLESFLYLEDRQSFNLSAHLNKFKQATTFQEKISIYRTIRTEAKSASKLYIGRLFRSDPDMQEQLAIEKNSQGETQSVTFNPGNFSTTALGEIITYQATSQHPRIIIDSKTGQTIVSFTRLSELGRSNKRKKQLADVIASVKAAVRISFKKIAGHSSKIAADTTVKDTSANAAAMFVNDSRNKKLLAYLDEIHGVREQVKRVVIRGGLEQEVARALIANQANHPDRCVTIIRQHVTKITNVIYPSSMLQTPKGLNQNALNAMLDKNHEDRVLSITIEEKPLFSDVEQRAD